MSVSGVRRVSTLMRRAPLVTSQLQTAGGWLPMGLGSKTTKRTRTRPHCSHCVTCRGMVDLVLKRGPCADYPWSYCLMYSVTHETLLRLHRKGVNPALATHRAPTLQLRPPGGLGTPNLGHVTHVNCLHGCVAHADCLLNDLVGKCPVLCSERDPKRWSRA